MFYCAYVVEFFMRAMCSIKCLHAIEHLNYASCCSLCYWNVWLWEKYICLDIPSAVYSCHHLFDEMPQSASLLVFMFIFVPFYSRRSPEFHFSCLSRLNCVVVVQDVT